MPAPPFDLAAGVVCDFAVHGNVTVNHVVTKVLQTYPDGAIKRDVFTGPLIYLVTNTETGASVNADASGSAIVDHHLDGSQTWQIIGPLLIGFRDNGGNLPRGLYVIDGLYRLDISPTGFLTVTMLFGSQESICDHLS